MMSIEVKDLFCLIVLFSGYHTVNSEVTKIFLSNPTTCKTCQSAPMMDFVPFSIDPNPCPASESVADTVSVTLALNKSKKNGCSVCQAREEEKLSYGACRMPIEMRSSYDAQIQEGGLHALNNKVVRLAGTPFSPSYRQSGYCPERPACPHLRQCQADDSDQQMNCQ